jgi:hypothetical protein
MLFLFFIAWKKWVRVLLTWMCNIRFVGKQLIISLWTARHWLKRWTNVYLKLWIFFALLQSYLVFRTMAELFWNKVTLFSNFLILLLKIVWFFFLYILQQIHHWWLSLVIQTLLSFLSLRYYHNLIDLFLISFVVIFTQTVGYTFI